jgi:hypothetical protein
MNKLIALTISLLSVININAEVIELDFSDTNLLSSSQTANTNKDKFNNFTIAGLTCRIQNAYWVKSGYLIFPKSKEGIFKFPTFKDKTIVKVELMAAYTSSSTFKVFVYNGSSLYFNYTFSDTESYVGCDITPNKSDEVDISVMTNSLSYNSYLKKIRITFADDDAVANPEITLPEYFIGSTSASISLPEASSEASIYYSTNKDAKSEDFILYDKPIDITQSCTIRAFARLNDVDSEIIEANTTSIIAPVASPGNMNDELQFESNELTININYDESNASIPNDRFLICYSLDNTTPTSEKVLSPGENLTMNYSAGRQILNLCVYDSSTDKYTSSNTYIYSPVAKNLNNLVVSNSPIHYNGSLLAKIKYGNEIYAYDETSDKSILLFDNDELIDNFVSGSYLTDFDFIYASGSDDNVENIILKSKPTISDNTADWAPDKLIGNLTDDDYSTAVYVYGTVTEYYSVSQGQPAKIKVEYGNDYSLYALNYFSSNSSAENINLRRETSDFKWSVNDNWPEQDNILNKTIYIGGVVGKYDQSPVLFVTTMSDNEDTLTNVSITNSYKTLVNVYNIYGECIRKNIKLLDAATNLPSGIYIINGQKVYIR